MSTIQETSENLLRFCGDQKYATIYADPPWRFQNRTGKVAPEHKRLNRYETMELEDIMALPVAQVAAACGFSDPFYFSRCFSRHFSVSPSRWRAEHL